MQINSLVEILPIEISSYSQMDIKNEPMLFRCDKEHAYQQGGKITKEVLDKLPESWQNVPLVIDSRVHMLMPGWMPCIPGWHHDDVPRTREDRQPNYAEGQDRSEHILVLCNGDICPTEFALGSAEFDEPPLGKTIYDGWDKIVQAMCEEGTLSKISIPTNRLVKFDDRTWHQGTPAIANGWRFFMRVSRHFSADGLPTTRKNPSTNEVRSQVQVYLPIPKAGW